MKLCLFSATTTHKNLFDLTVIVLTIRGKFYN